MLDLEVVEPTLEPTIVEEPTEIVKEKKSKKKEKIEEDLAPETLLLIKKAEESILKALDGDKKRLSKYGEAVAPPEFISTGCYAADKVMGGGLALGGMYIFTGPRGTSKSAFLAWCLKQFIEKLPQKAHIYFDFENAVNSDFWSACGLDSRKVIVSSPQTTEQGLDALKEAIQSGLFGLVCIDSTNGMVPKQRKEKKADEATMALNAKLFSERLPELKDLAKYHNCTVVMISQERVNLGGYISAPTVSANGKSAEYFSDAIFKFTRVSNEDIKEGKNIIGLTIQIQNQTKNRYTTPFQSSTFTLMFPHVDPDTGLLTAGVDKYADLAEALIDKEIAISGGAWISYNKGEPDEVKWNGKKALIKDLKTNIDNYNLFKNLVYGKARSK